MCFSQNQAVEPWKDKTDTNEGEKKYDLLSSVLF